MTSRTWLITGANSGFGREMTEQLLARGERVAGTVRDLASMADLRALHGERLWLAELDLTDTPAIRRVVDQAFKALGSIEVVVSNAGYGLFGAAEEMTDQQIEHQLGTNLLGSIQLLRAALPHLRAQGGGRILQLSTMGGRPFSRVVRCTMRASGELKALSAPWARKWLVSTSAAPSSNPVAHAPVFATAARNWRHAWKTTTVLLPATHGG